MIGTQTVEGFVQALTACTQRYMQIDVLIGSLMHSHPGRSDLKALDTKKSIVKMPFICGLVTYIGYLWYEVKRPTTQYCCQATASLRAGTD